MYFDNVNKADDLRKAYREYVKVLHPDRGGDKTAFQSMQQEYEEKLRELLTNADSKRVSREEIVALIRLLNDWLKRYRPHVWQILNNLYSQPLAVALFEQFASREVKEYARLLGIIK